MLNIREYQDEATKMSKKLRKKFGITRDSQVCSIYPKFIVKEGKLNLASFIEPDKEDEFRRYGLLHIFSQKEIVINNVASYTLCVNSGADILTIGKYDVLEIGEMDDFYVICICPLEIKKDSYYYDIVSFRLEIYHNEERIYAVNNVEQYYDIGNNLKILYAIRTGEKYEHWFYNNGISEMLVIDDKRYLDKSEYGIKDYYRDCNIFDDDGNVEIFFHEIPTKSCYVLKEFAKNADDFYIVENEFEDDNTLNYVIKLKSNRLDDVAFVRFCLLMNTDMPGYAIYNIPLSQCRLGLVGNDNERISLIIRKMKLSKLEENFYKSIIVKLYEKYGEETNFFEFPSAMNFECKNAMGQMAALDKFLVEQHPAYKEMSETREKVHNLLDQFKIQYNCIYQSLLDNGVFSPKWKSEYELFKMIKRTYPKAVYQYRVSWLGHQSLDIFLPEEKIAFEYQGVQHYKPVEVFGGEEHFEKQKVLDERKRLLCKENGVKLIEWRYDEPISKILLDKKMKNS